MKLLIPIDFTEATDHTLELAISLGQTIDTELVFIHVVSNSNGILEATTRLKDKISERGELTSISHRIAVLHGNLYETLADFGEKETVDFMILGIHDASGLSKMMGSKAIKVIANCSFPIVTMKTSDHLKTLKKIVITLDLVNKSVQVVKHAQLLASIFGAKVYLVGGAHTEANFKTKSNINAAIAKKYLLEKGIECEVVLLPRKKFVNNLFEFCAANEVDLLAATFYNDNETVFSIPFIRQLMDNSLGIPTLVVDSIATSNSGQLAGIIS